MVLVSILAVSLFEFIEFSFLKFSSCDVDPNLLLSNRPIHNFGSGNNFDVVQPIEIVIARYHGKYFAL